MGKHGTSVQSGKFEQEHVQKALLKQILIDELPFSVVKQDGFKESMEAIFLEFQIPSPDIISRDCVQLFMEEKLKLKSFIKDIKQRVCLTLDTWKSKSSQSVNYLCITAHFIDDTWKLHKKIIGFTPILSDRGEEIGRLVENCLNDWEISNVLAISTVNGGLNDAAIAYLRGRLPNLIMDGKFLHLKCAIDITNDIVKGVLKKYEDSIARVRAAIRCVLQSASRVKMFQACIEEFLTMNLINVMNVSSLSLDCPSRWDSTFKMLKAAQEYELIFDWFEKSPTYMRDLVGPAPVYKDWEKVKRVVDILSGFHRSIENISKMHLTSVKFLTEISSIDFHLDYIGKSSGSYKSMETALDMKWKFDEYWGYVDTSNMLIYLANILDPSAKNWDLEGYFMNNYKHDYDDDDGTPTWKKKAEFVLGATYDLFNEYAVKIGATSQIANFQSSGYMEYLYNDKSTGGLFSRRVIGFGCNVNCKTELDIYLNEVSDDEYYDVDDDDDDDDVVVDDDDDDTDDDDDDDVVDDDDEEEEEEEEEDDDDDDYNYDKLKGCDVLCWWKKNSARFPVLSKMAKDVLAIQICVVDPKLAYNMNGNGNVLNDFQSTLSPSVVEALVCTKDWIQKSVKQTKVKKGSIDLDKLVTDVYQQEKNATK